MKNQSKCGYDCDTKGEGDKILNLHFWFNTDGCGFSVCKEGFLHGSQPEDDSTTKMICDLTGHFLCGLELQFQIDVFFSSSEVCIVFLDFVNCSFLGKVVTAAMKKKFVFSELRFGVIMSEFRLDNTTCQVTFSEI